MLTPVSALSLELHFLQSPTYQQIKSHFERLLFIFQYCIVLCCTVLYCSVQYCTLQYWKRSKSRSKWDFICCVGGCKKWSSKDRADTSVHIKLYSSLKCVCEKSRNFFEDEGRKENYTITQFEKCKFKSIKKKNN